MTPEQEVDNLLREFQRACETVVVRGDSNLSETTKLRAILRNDLRARLLSSTPTRAATDAGTCDCYTLRIRLNDLRNEQREIAALFGIVPCYDDTPHSWSVGDTGDVSLLALMRDVAARLSSSPSSTTATPDTLHPADEAMLQSYATRQIGEGMPGMVQDASKLARYAIILRMQLSRALPSSRALSEEEQSALVQAFIAFDRSSTTRPLATIIGEIVTRERGGFCGSPESDTCTCASQLGFRACLSAGAPK